VNKCGGVACAHGASEFGLFAFDARVCFELKCARLFRFGVCFVGVCENCLELAAARFALSRVVSAQFAVAVSLLELRASSASARYGDATRANWSC
jgi:hypothetical protein